MALFFWRSLIRVTSLDGRYDDIQNGAAARGAVNAIAAQSARSGAEDGVHSPLSFS